MVQRSGCACRCEDRNRTVPPRAGQLLHRGGVGSGVFEARIDFGPGYRIYFGKDGETVVILLGGSTKKRQSAAIAAAHKAWTDYKQRKKGAG
jgi:putative addiction module killer protein